MNSNIDQFCDKLKVRLTLVGSKLETLKLNLQKLPGKTEQSLRTSLNEVQAQFEVGKERVKVIQANLADSAELKMVETKEAINHWIANRETRKLNQRAERTEALAADAVEYALAMVQNAEEAILEAAIARAEANSTNDVTQPALA